MRRLPIGVLGAVAASCAFVSACPPPPTACASAADCAPGSACIDGEGEGEGEGEPALDAGRS